MSEDKISLGWDNSLKGYRYLDYKECCQTIKVHKNIVKQKPPKWLYNPAKIRDIRTFMKNKNVVEPLIKGRIYDIFLKTFLATIKHPYYRNRRENEYRLTKDFESYLKIELPTVHVGLYEFTLNKHWMDLFRNDLVYNNDSARRFLVGEARYEGEFAGGYVYQVKVYKNRDLSKIEEGWLSFDLNKSNMVFSKSLYEAKRRLQEKVLAD